MIITFQTDASETQARAAASEAERSGLKAYVRFSGGRWAVAIVGAGRVRPGGADRLNERLAALPGVASITADQQAFVLASRAFVPETTSFSLSDTPDGVRVGGSRLLLIAGPCSVEDRSQLLETALAVKEAGAHALRGGAFKPRTSPYSFQGLGEAGLEMLAEARQLTGLPIVTEVMTPEDLPLVARYADVLQIGARNMQNSPLLHAAGASQKPVLLKRGMSATLEEMLFAAEYILSHDNFRVMVCERGIRTFENSLTRNTTDINAVPVLKSISHLPVMLDPSHSTGSWEYVTAIARAAVAAGADGLIVEVHPHPEQALSDGAQSLKPERFAELVRQVSGIANWMERTV